jgi:two-component system, cell cycle response regulator DivK
MTDLSKQIILVVDDEPDNLEVFKATMEMLYEATVHVAASGKEALQCLESIQPTLIVTDLSMPELDGYALLHHLRTRPDSCRIPVIAVTAHAMAGDRSHILEAGFDGYISKPFDISILGDQIGQCMADAAARTAMVNQVVYAEVQKLNVEVLGENQNHESK